MNDKDLSNDEALDITSDAREQNGNFNAFGFDKAFARRNLILAIFAFLISALGAVSYLYHQCQKQHANEIEQCQKQRVLDIERLTTKYETKIEVLYEKLIGEK